jgi:hypothetical protein
MATVSDPENFTNTTKLLTPFAVGFITYQNRLQKGVSYLVVFIKKMGSRQTVVEVFFAVCDDTMLDDGKVSIKRTSRVFPGIKILGKGQSIYKRARFT